MSQPRTGPAPDRPDGRTATTPYWNGQLTDGTRTAPYPGGSAAGTAPVVTTRAVPGRRNLPRVLTGLALIVVCSLLFAVIATRSTPERPVLALTRAVSAGQMLSADDLTTVRVSGEAAKGLVPADQQAAWTGRTVTGPLPAGQLLTPANLGPADWPPAGQAVVAAALPAGHLPAGVVPGSQVRVVLAQASSSTPVAGSGGSATATDPTSAAAGTRTLAATVVEVSGSATSASSGTRTTSVGGGSGTAAADSSVSPSGGAVVSLLMGAQDAAVVAASDAGDVSVILQLHVGGE